MKNILLSCLILLTNLSLCLAQIPQGIYYQGVAVNSEKEAIRDQKISVRLSILRGEFNGLSEYIEIHSITTNSFGMFNLVIGQGEIEEGYFEDITWKEGNKFLKIEMDEQGGENYKYLGTSQFLSVPYALYAENTNLQKIEGDIDLNIEKTTVGLDPSRHFILLKNNSVDEGSYAGIRTLSGESGGLLDVGYHSSTYGRPKYADYGQVSSTGNGLILRAFSDEGILSFQTGSVDGESLEHMRLTNTGFLGLGTTSPSSPLQIEHATEGLDSTRFLLTLKNPSVDEGSFSAIKTYAGEGGGYLSVGHHSPSYGSAAYADYGQVMSTGKGLVMRAFSDEGILSFQTGSVDGESLERARITNDGLLGIGVSNPSSPLHIERNTEGLDSLRLFIKLKNNSTDQGSYAGMRSISGNSGGFLDIGYHASSYGRADYADFGQVSSTGNGLILRAFSENGILSFQTGSINGASVERMRLTDEGFLGIGTDRPKAKLQVTDGDIYIEEINKGIIMKSPNGNCWRVTIGDDGEFVKTQVECP